MMLLLLPCSVNRRARARAYPHEHSLSTILNPARFGQDCLDLRFMQYAELDSHASVGAGRELWSKKTTTSQRATSHGAGIRELRCLPRLREGCEGSGGRR